MLLISKFKISGHSMEPEIKNGNEVLVSGIFYIFKKPNINDVVAFRNNKTKVFVKRITKIYNEKYFLEGDNKDDSFDSRSLGWISKEKILGKVIKTL